MFDFVREKKRLVQVVLALIILPFAFWGMDSYQNSGDSPASATVDDVKISQQELDDAMRQQQERLRQMMGGNVDPSLLDSPEMKRSVLDGLVARQLLVSAAQSAGLRVSDEALAEFIGGLEAFQVNGVFDKAQYESALRERGMSPAMFEARLREDMLGQQVRDAYLYNGFASNDVAGKLIRLNEQQRTISVAGVSIATLAGKVTVSDADVKAYFEKNPKEFQIPEQARVEYVKFSARDLADAIAVSADEIKQYYESHQNEFGAPEQRRAAHILISVAQAAPQTEHDAALKKAEQVLAQAKREPGKFAELAKAHSQDPGSAAIGGDLGFFGQGMMVKPFEEAAFALKQGELSGVVKSDFGYHIIKLLELKPAQLIPLGTVRADIEAKLRQQKADEQFAELAEKFSNTVYEQSDTLKPAAELIKGHVAQSDWLVKGMPAAEPWTAKMLQAVFSEDAVKSKRNTAAIEVAANTLVAARILEHKPAAVRPLAEVQAVVHAKLVQQRAAAMAVEQGKSMLAQLNNGSKPSLNWSPAQQITRGQHGSLDAALVRQVYQADAAKLPRYVGAEVPQGFILVRIDAVGKDGEVEELKLARYAQQLRQMTGEEMFRAYLGDLKQNASIEVHLPEAAPAQP
ncbi:MAG: SurA N-terminal domain-containing protein [Gallionella sp.]|nr:SurA N-terminal domain-containing protein [Gallionella sp.]